MQTFMGMESDASKEHPKDKVYSQPIMLEMINALSNLDTTENDLKSFKEYIEAEMKKEDSSLNLALSGVQYTYDLDMLVYTENVDGKIVQSDAEKLLMDAIKDNMGMDMSAMLEMQNSSPMGSMMGGSMMGKVWTEMLSGKDGSLISPVLENQYDVIYGSWPNSYDEIVIIVNENNEINDLTLYALGLRSHDEIAEVFDAVMHGNGELDTKLESWTYEEICDMTFRVVLNSDCYTLDKSTGIYNDLRVTADGEENEAGLRYLYDNGFDLKVSGIIRPSENATSSMLTGSIAYTKALTEYVIEKADNSAALKAQKADPSTDIFTGLPFNENTGNLSESEKAAEYRNYINSLSDAGKAEAYVAIKSIMPEDLLKSELDKYMSQLKREDIENQLVPMYAQQMGLSEDELRAYLAQMSDEELFSRITPMIEEQIKKTYEAQVAAQFVAVPTETLAGYMVDELAKYTDAECAKYYDETLEFSDSTYDDNLVTLGCLDLDSPATVNLFASSFENKDIIEAAITSYNNSVDELKQIKYTDYIGILLSSITTIINAITYILIAFVAISLIVSSIMIGVITLISVQERTKEIGILRAIGASKRNVSSMFNAETVIIGFTSGLIGVVVTYLLCIPINAIIYALTDIPNLQAQLPVAVAAILILISVLLTLISGIIPSRSAAKKDPVVALRTE